MGGTLLVRPVATLGAGGLIPERSIVASRIVVGRCVSDISPRSASATDRTTVVLGRPIGEPNWRLSSNGPPVDAPTTLAAYSA